MNPMDEEQSPIQELFSWKMPFININSSLKTNKQTERKPNLKKPNPYFHRKEKRKD